MILFDRDQSNVCIHMEEYIQCFWFGDVLQL